MTRPIIPKRNSTFPLTPSGCPSSYAVFRLINRLFTNSSWVFSVDALAKEAGMSEDTVTTVCRQLAMLDLICETSPFSRKYHYNVNCGNVELQATVEGYLIDFPKHAADLDLPLLPPESSRRR